MQLCNQSDHLDNDLMQQMIEYHLNIYGTILQRLP